MGNDRNFHFFSQLPTELRLIIWRHCLPHRVVELDGPFDECVYHLEEPTPCELQETSAINRHPPLISRVCRESRLVASEDRRLLDEDVPPDAQWSSPTRFTKLCIDPSRDTIHLNWTPFYVPNFWNDGSPFDNLAWNSPQVQGRGSFMFDYLQDSFPEDSDVEQRIGAMQNLQHGAVVIRVIVVHTTFQNAANSGLFGLLGDAPVQIVNVSDEPRLDALFDFAKRCESDAKRSITKRQDFQRDSPESIKALLKEKLVETFEAAAQALPPIHPAIMFRFCPLWCNHS
jgi:hypothetical protein